MKRIEQRRRGPVDTRLARMATAMFLACMLLLPAVAHGQKTQAPTITPIPDQSIDEDTPTPLLSFQIGDPDTPLAQLTASKSSSNTNLIVPAGIILGGAGSNRTVRVVPRTNQSGIAVITLGLSDGPNTTTRSFEVRVNPVNDRPQISSIDDVSVGRNQVGAPVPFVIGDVDNVVSQLQLTPSTDNSILLPPENIRFFGDGNNRTLVFKPAPNQVGVANVRITVTDPGGATAIEEFKVTVTGASGGPQIVRQPEDAFLIEGETLSLSVGATGTAPLKYQWRYEGVAIPGQTASNLTVLKVTTGYAGSYDVLVSNSEGSTASNPVNVDVSEAQRDFGDAPEPPYSTTAAGHGASQRVHYGFHLGIRVDGDDGTMHNATATADDTNNVEFNDEDGVTLLDPLIVGRTARVQVVFIRNSDLQLSGALGVWIDWNRNGGFDPGEKIIAARTDGTGTALLKTGTNVFTVTVPSTAVPGATFARFRLSETPIDAAGGPSDEFGEVEDYMVNVQGDQQTATATEDFGDAPEGNFNYPTTLARNGARHKVVNGVFLGARVDAETNGVPNVTATGDDLAPAAADDEDGVLAPNPLRIGANTIAVRASVAGQLWLWIDFNADGDWADAGEKVFNGRAVTAGTNILTVNIPAGAAIGTTYARFRFGVDLANLDFDGPAANGEVEDYRVNIQAAEKEELDFGDAPEKGTSFPTTLARDGARHFPNDDLYLGTYPDREPDGQPDSLATGDDLAGTGDEDGIVMTPLVPGVTNTVDVIAHVRPGLSAFLDAWIDFNGDRRWDKSEMIFNSRFVTDGTQTLGFLVPATATNGLVFTRWRLSRTGGLDVTGDGGDGEVEDHRVLIKKARDQGDSCDLSCAGTDFWLAYPGNYAPDPLNPVQPSICVLGPAGSVITVTNHANGVVSVFTNTAGTFRINLNKVTDLGDLNDGVARKGVHVTVSAPSTINALSKVTYTSDGYLALPTPVLGTDYIVVGYSNVHVGVPELSGSQFALLATEPDTPVTIIPSDNVGIRARGVPYTITLTNAGDCYQLRTTNDAPADLTGTRIISGKPVAVFGGHQVANVNSMDVFFADYLVEQLPPVRRWGMEYYTGALAWCTNGYALRVVTSQPDTTIQINGSGILVTNGGGWHETVVLGPAQITADKPVYVAQYAPSADFNSNTNTDPFMVTVPSLPTWSAGSTFCTPSSGFVSNFVTMVTLATASATLKVDGTAPASFSASINGSGYVSATMAVAPGVHTVTCSQPVGVIVYGFGPYESYAWPGCMFFGDTTPPVVRCLTNQVTLPLPRGSDACTLGLPSLKQLVTYSDKCGMPLDVSIEQSPPAGTQLGVGSHEVTLYVRDAAGNVGRCTITVTVTDPDPGGGFKLLCPRDMVVRCTDKDGAVVQFSADLLQGCTPVTNVPVICSPPSGSKFPPGTNVVTCQATVAGQSLQCRFAVVVNCQRQAPTIKVNTLSSAAGNPSLRFDWDDDGTTVLEQVDALGGNWSRIENARSGHTVPTTGGRARFFRLRQK